MKCSTTKLTNIEIYHFVLANHGNQLMISVAGIKYLLLKEMGRTSIYMYLIFIDYLSLEYQVKNSFFFFE